MLIYCLDQQTSGINLEEFIHYDKVKLKKIRMHCNVSGLYRVSV